MKFAQAIPILFSSDIQRSLRYYVDVLGFEQHWDWGNPPDFGGVSKDGVDVFFCLNGQGNRGTWISIVVDDVDEYYQLVKPKGAVILKEAETMEWYMREMFIQDPDGHILRVGHRVDCD